ncbi:DUF4082 domain-containing protein [Nocardioides sp. WG-D5]
MPSHSMPPSTHRRRIDRPPHDSRRTTRWRRTAVVSVLVTLITGGALWTFGPATAHPETLSLLPDDAVPTVLTDPDSRPVELGLRFRTSRPVEAVAVQVYLGPHNHGPHPATLWSEGGVPLARVQVGGAAGEGLKVAELDRPIRLEPGRSYVVSYTAPRGHYSTDEYFFDRSISNGPLSAGTNAGVYTYEPGEFPRSTYRATNYQVDVVVRPTGSDEEPTTSPSPSGSPTPSGAPPTLSPSPSTSAGPTAPASTPTAPSASPSSPSSAPTTAAPSPTSAPPSGGFPTRASAGLPDGWQPKRSVTGTYTINTPGAVVEDLRVTNGTINVTARNVTLRRVQAVGSVIANYTSATCATGLVIEDSEIVRGAAPTTDEAWPAVTSGGYTARNVLIDGVPEGFRAQGRSACGGVGIYDSYVRVVSPDVCTDWHGDGIQGYGGGALTVRKTVIDFVDTNNCGGTAPFFYPDQDNTSVDIDGLVVSGGGYPFRLGTPGSVRNLYVVDRSWVFGPLDVRCSLITQWQAATATLNSAGQPVVVRNLPCTT